MTETDWPLPGVPYAVQLEALRYVRGKKACGLWLDMGLGKTSIVLADFMNWKNRNEVDVLLIIGPHSLRGMWRDEVSKWTPDLVFAEWPTVARLHRCPADVIFVNYEAMIASGGMAVEVLVNAKRVYMVADESHRIKNPSAQVTKAVLLAAKSAIVRRSLTGTPMTNNVMDLWPQLRFSGGLDGVNPYVFRNRYAKRGGFMGKQIVGVSDMDAVREEISHVAFQARKSDWLDLPPKTWQTIPVEMDPVLLPYYEEMRRDFMVTLGDGSHVSALAVVAQLLKLQQISSGFVIDAARVPRRLIPIARSGKFAALNEIIDGTRSKVLIFTHYVETTAALIEATGAVGLTGGMTHEALQAAKYEFNSDAGPRLMVAQLSVGALGHTLLGGPNMPCHTVCFYENNFNLGNRLQAEDRVHRIGQRNPVIYYDIVSTAIERTVIRALQQKRDLIEALMTDIPLRGM